MGHGFGSAEMIGVAEPPPRALGWPATPQIFNFFFSFFFLIIILLF